MSVDTGPGSPPPRGSRMLLRRAPLIVVLLLLAWLFLGDRPREVVLEYDLPEEPAPVRVEVRIRASDGSTPAAIEWGGGAGPARDRQTQRALLAPGSYRLEATLIDANGARRQLERPLEIGRDDDRIVVHLTPR